MKLIYCLLLFFLIQMYNANRSHKSKNVIRIPLKLDKPKPIKKHSSGARTKILLENQTEAYSADVNIGHQLQPLKVVFETRSNFIWFFSSKYDSCDKYSGIIAKHRTYTPKFEQAKPKPGFLRYPFGWLFGFWITDSITLGPVQNSSMNFVYVTKATRTVVNLKYDGVVGLQYNPPATNIMTTICQIEGGENKFAFHYSKNGSEPGPGELLLCENDRSLYEENTLKYFDVIKPGTWKLRFNKIEMRRNEGRTPLGANVAILIEPTAVFISIPEDVFSAISKLTGAINSAISDLKEVDCDKIGSLPELRFWIGEEDYQLSGENYVRKYLDGSRIECQLLFKTTTSAHWTLGAAFVRKFYTSFDMQNHKIGFATSR